MSDVIACPQCTRQLILQARHLGRTVCCAACGMTFVAADEPSETDPHATHLPFPAPCEPLDEGEELTVADLETALSTASGRPPDRRPARLPRETPEESRERRPDPVRPSRPRRRHREEDEDAGDKSDRGLRVAAGLCLVMVALGALLLVLFRDRIFGTARDTGEAWQEFSPPGAGCTVLMPGTPERQERFVPEARTNVVFHQVTLRNPERAFGISHFRLPPHEVHRVPVEARFEGSKQGILAETPEASLVGERSLRVEGFPAREFVFDVSRRGKMTARVIAAGPDFYLLLAGGDGFEPTSPDVVKFLDSFRRDKTLAPKLTPAPQRDGRPEPVAEARPAPPLPDWPPRRFDAPRREPVQDRWGGEDIEVREDIFSWPNAAAPERVPTEEIERVAVGNGQEGPLAADGKVWETLQQGIGAGSLRNSSVVNGRWGSNPFREVPEEGALLIGFYCEPADYMSYVRPIYLTAQGEKLGRAYGNPWGKTVCRLKAKPGYAVGAITVRSGDLFDGMGLTFMRVKEDGLDPQDSYTSSWVGGHGGAGFVVGGDGSFLVGVRGRLKTQGGFNAIGSVVTLGCIGLRLPE